MDFTVTTSDGSEIVYSGDARYQLDPGNAVLTVWTGGNDQVAYSPSHWVKIHTPGQPETDPIAPVYR